MSRVFIANETTVPIIDKNGIELNEKTIHQMIWGCNNILPRLANSWKVICPRVVYYTGEWEPQPIDYLIKIDDSVKNIIDEGGFILSDKSISDSTENISYIHASQSATISANLFSKIAKILIGDSLWKSGKPLTILNEDGTTRQSLSTFSNGITLCDADVCDPVQQNFIVVKYLDIDIALSDFILPAWKDNDNTVGPFNYTTTLHQPFTVDIGGNVTIIDSMCNQQKTFSKDVVDIVIEIIEEAKEEINQIIEKIAEAEATETPVKKHKSKRRKHKTTEVPIKKHKSKRKHKKDDK
jgi:hypothetical protein